jgi:hypothetical protein
VNYWNFSACALLPPLFIRYAGAASSARRPPALQISSSVLDPCFLSDPSLLLVRYLSTHRPFHGSSESSLNLRYFGLTPLVQASLIRDRLAFSICISLNDYMPPLLQSKIRTFSSGSSISLQGTMHSFRSRRKSCFAVLVGA